MPKFVLLKPTYWDTPMWVEDTPTGWINYSGGQIPKNAEDKILEQIQAIDFWDLDWTKTGLVFLWFRGGPSAGGQR